MSDMMFREPNQIKWLGTRPGHNGTQVLEDNTVNNGTVVLYTVAAGEIFYWCGWNINVRAPAYASNTYLEVYDDVPALWKEIQRGGTGANQVNLLSKSYWPPLEIPAGYSVRIRSTIAGHAINASIHGWVE